MGTFRIDRSDAIVSVGNDLNLSDGGNLTFELGEYESALIDVANSLSTHPSDSVLTIDGSFYRGGSDTFELIRFGGLSGSFAATNVVMKGFKANQSAAVSIDADSLNVSITTDAVADVDSRLWFSMTPSAGTTSAASSDLQLNNEHQINRHLTTMVIPVVQHDRA